MVSQKSDNLQTQNIYGTQVPNKPLCISIILSESDSTLTDDKLKLLKGQNDLPDISSETWSS